MKARPPFWLKAGCEGSVAWVPHIAFVLVMLVPCQNKMLREKPAAAAVRAVAPYFFALRERRRRLGERVGAGSSSRRSSPTRRSKAGRVRPGRLRDRLRAVSYRILRASRLASPEAPPAMHAAREAQLSKVAKGSSQGNPGSKNSPSQQLATASRWVRKRVKPLTPAQSIIGNTGAKIITAVPKSG